MKNTAETPETETEMVITPDQIQRVNDLLDRAIIDVELRRLLAKRLGQ